MSLLRIRPSELQPCEGKTLELALDSNQTTLEAIPRQELAPGVCIHELFEKQVERTPLHVALVHEEEQLTYGELNRRSNQLARHLQRLGAGPEIRIGLCFERSLDMVVGLMGILKAGGAYVPLEPAQSVERLARMMEYAQVPLLLTSQRLRASLPSTFTRTILLEDEWGEIGQESGDNRKRPILTAYAQCG
jgi:non-ribosomal peptide synthetase component F